RRSLRRPASRRFFLPPLLLLSYLHQHIVHLLAHAFLCLRTPLHAGKLIVVNDKSAFLTGHLGIAGKNLNHIPAPGTLLFLPCGRPQPRRPLTSFHHPSSPLIHSEFFRLSKS